MEVADILNTAKKYLKCRVPQDTLPKDSLPILVAIADTKKVLIGITIQKEYPLTLIERNFGVPFARLRSNSERIISDPDLLHQFKWNFGVHIAEFEADSINEIFAEIGQKRKVVSVLSTGIGNVLQNKRAVAYLEGDRFFSVEGESRAELPPYTCLIARQDKTISIELLRFSQNHCRLVDKELYMSGKHREALSRERTINDDLKWAISGYPLIIAGQKVSLEEIARNVSDLRHIWSLPKLQNSISKYLEKSLKGKSKNIKLEFYFGFDKLREGDYFFDAVREKTLVFEMRVITDDLWKDTICSICNINTEDLERCEIYNKLGEILLKREDLVQDFKRAGYEEVSEPDQIKSRGQFAIQDNRLYVKLLPGIYPHHLIGISENGNIVNVSIGGLSGRTGVTIEDTQEFCQEIGLKDAIIFDNGFDVVSQIGGIQGSVIRHKDNTRQTRVTAALHFGRTVEKLSDEDFGGYFDGFDLGYSTFNVYPYNTR